jgi:threonine dehydratase
VGDSAEEVARGIAGEVLEAEERIRPHIRETPLEHSPFLSRRSRGDVHLKLENLQITGSFKLRGAVNKLLSLGDQDRALGIVTASTGNHGAAVAYTLAHFGCTGTIFVPNDASPAKIDRLRQLGANLEFAGDDCVETELHARRTAEARGMVYLSPYNDPKVIGGQGTVGLELDRQLDSTDAVLVPVGGGGLIAGIAGYLKSAHPDIEIVGCQPENSAVMYESVRAGRIVEMESLPTLSDGTAGGIEPGAITYEMCRDLVDDFILVSEEEIRGAIRTLVESHSLLVEGAAALPVAALERAAARFDGRRVVLILTGAKISLETLRSVLA